LLLAIYFDLPEPAQALVDKCADTNASVEGYNALSHARLYERSAIEKHLVAIRNASSRGIGKKTVP